MAKKSIPGNIIHEYLLISADSSISVDYPLSGYPYGYGADADIIFVWRSGHGHPWISIEIPRRNPYRIDTQITGQLNGKNVAGVIPNPKPHRHRPSVCWIGVVALFVCSNSTHLVFIAGMSLSSYIFLLRAHQILWVIDVIIPKVRWLVKQVENRDSAYLRRKFSWIRD
jgi:hypothetical protein